MSDDRTNEQRYFDALKAIGRDYMSADQLLRKSHYGCDPAEELQMAYDNIQELAKRAIKGKRRPK